MLNLLHFYTKVVTIDLWWAILVNNNPPKKVFYGGDKNIHELY